MYKKILCNTAALLLLILAPLYTLQAQYTSPGDNLVLTLSDLVDMSDGVVTQDEDGFMIHEDIIISVTDRLEILDAAYVKVAAEQRIEIYGEFISDPVSGHVTFTAADTTSSENNFRGFRFEDAQPTMFRNTTVMYGGGIQLIGTMGEFRSCVIRNNGTSNGSSAITYRGNPIIDDCEFIENEGSALGSGANILGSPQITNNRFIHNVMNNTNRAQINLGPGAAGDTLRIEHNYIEGLNDNSGGIGLTNLLGSGTTIASVRHNTIVGNRYGYAQIGNGFSTVVEDNIFLDNDIQGNPNLGGSGMNFQSSEANNTAIVRRNIISGNLWGVTLQGEANPSFGTEDEPGGNVFYDNGNGGAIHALFNNTPQDITAIGNYWGDNTEEFAESVISHQPDIPSLGLVTYMPINELNAEFESFTFLAADNSFLDEDLVGTIDPENYEIRFEVAAGTDVSNLTPSASVALGVEATPDLNESQNFSSAVVYTLSVPHGDEQEWTVILEEPAAELATLQLIHSIADPAAEMVDVYINGEIFLEGFAYGTATAYVEAPAEVSLAVEIRIADTETVLFTDTYMLEANTAYSINAAGVSDPDEFVPNPDGNNIEATLLVTAEARTEAQNEDNVEFFVVHTATDAPAVDVRSGTSLLVDGAGYGDATDYISVAADAYVLGLFIAGTEELISLYTADLSAFAGQSAVVVARGFLDSSANQDGAGFELVVVLANGDVITLEDATSTEPGIDGPEVFTLSQNYPNPFNPTTNISFTLPEAGDVTLEVFNVQGQRVAMLVNGSRSAGSHSVSFNAEHLASGIYLYRLQSGSLVQTNKMMLVK